MKKIFSTTLFFLVLFSSVSSFAADEKSASKNFGKTVAEHASGDLKETFLSWPVFVIAGGGVAAGILAQYDTDISSHFQKKHMGGVDKVTKFIGEPYVFDTAALAFWGASAIAKDKKLSVTGESMVEALIFTEAFTGGLKLMFGRERPSGGGYSFPSGHAARTFAVATVLETQYGPFVGVPAYLAAGLISFARVDAHEHFASDVLFGAALGSAIGWGTAVFHEKKDPALFVTPMAGAVNGVMISYNF